MKKRMLNATRGLLMGTAGVILIGTVLPAEAQIVTNGTGGGDFGTPSTWDGGAVPGSNESWTVLSGDSVTYASGRSIYGGATGRVNGSLTANSGTEDITLGGGGGLLVVNGTVTVDRIFNSAPSLANFGGGVVMESGSLTVANRLVLDSTNTNNTVVNSFSQSGGVLDGSGAFAGFKLFGADADDRAQFSIVGNAGTFNFTNRGVILFNTSEGFEDSATDISFSFGAAAGDGALTVVQSGPLTLGGNAITIDFSAIDRNVYGGDYSTTLFDFSSITGTLGTLNTVGLEAGESASLFLDGANSLYRVDYSLVSIPEPSVIAAIAGLMALGLAGWRRQRKG